MDQDIVQVAAMQALLTTSTEVDNRTMEIYAQESLIEEKYIIYVLKAQCDPDTIYHHQDMKQPDSEKLKAAMTDEVKSQFENENFEIVSRASVPKNATILPAVWHMKRKRDIKTGTIKKYKARLNIDGSRMTK